MRLGKVELRRDANLLEAAALEAALRNTHDFANVVITPQIDFTAAQVRQLKEFYGEFFGLPAHGNEAKALAQETAAAFAALHNDLVQLAAQQAAFPFLAALAAPLGAIAGLVGKPYTFYLTDLPAQMESLLDAKEAVVDPIRRLMGGAQRQIYADARHYLAAQDANFAYAAGGEAAQLQAILDDPAVYRGNRLRRPRPSSTASGRRSVRPWRPQGNMPRPRSKNAGSASRAWPSSPISRRRSRASCAPPSTSSSVRWRARP